MDKKLTMLMILDGFGENKNEKGNAVKLAKTPNIDKLMKTCPTTDIYTSGLSVGLPEGQMGNSEVGHTNIGAGRIVYQELTRITKSIEDGDFFSIPEFVKAIVKRIIQSFMLWDFYLMEVCIAIYATYLQFLNLQKEKILKMYMFTAS